MKISEGSEWAFQLIFKRYHQRMLSFVVSLVKSPYAAEEIVQESFIRLWESRDLLADIKKPEDYLFIIVRNHALNYLRNVTSEQKRRKQLWESIENKTAYSDMELDKEDSERTMQEILTKLSPQQKKIFFLSRDKGLTHQEIAQELHLSKNTVKNHLTEALKIFKAQLKRSGFFHSFL